MFQMSDLQVVDPHIYRNVQALRYISAAGLVMLLYDHLLCFDDEVALIWKARWTIPKTLYLLLRYVVPICIAIHLHLLKHCTCTILN
uniref:DUF6533 domain-containing protein n=1 Tax=Moniliophthora roreri TaxID=221103 RepID=A0A0W0ETA0_MONRR